MEWNWKTITIFNVAESLKAFGNYFWELSNVKPN